MSLNNYSKEDLQQELNNREQRKQNAPQPFEEPDYSKANDLVVKYITEISETGTGTDITNDVYEAVMEAVYGKDIWNYIDRLYQLVRE